MHDDPRAFADVLSRAMPTPVAPPSTPTPPQNEPVPPPEKDVFGAIHDLFDVGFRRMKRLKARLDALEKGNGPVARLRCLELAAQGTHDPSEIVNRAQRFLNFVRGEGC
jgi:hypothetical protein